ncbi:hypothetical protein [Gemmatimonas sp.]|nr:hypothetical protein [Gemmatimonas sp.]
MEVLDASEVNVAVGYVARAKENWSVATEFAILCTVAVTNLERASVN